MKLSTNSFALTFHIQFFDIGNYLNIKRVLILESTTLSFHSIILEESIVIWDKAHWQKSNWLPEVHNCIQLCTVGKTLARPEKKWKITCNMSVKGPTPNWDLLDYLQLAYKTDNISVKLISF